MIRISPFSYGQYHVEALAVEPSTEGFESMVKKAPAPSGAGGGSKKTDSKEALVVVSKVKAALRSYDVYDAFDAADALNAVCHWYIEQAAGRVAANGRKTVRAHDFTV